MPDPELLNELLGQQGGADPQQKEPGLEVLRQQIQTPEDDFMVTLMEMADKRGELDEAMSAKPTVEEELDYVALEENPLGGYSKEEVEILLQKFEAMNPDVQQGMLSTIKQTNPVLHQQIMVAIRLVRGGDTQRKFNGM